VHRLPPLFDLRIQGDHKWDALKGGHLLWEEVRVGPEYGLGGLAVDLDIEQAELRRIELGAIVLQEQVCKPG
jgi:hypothetical protein